jgi:hypothetical protein
MSSKRSFWYSCALLVVGLLSVAPSSPRYSHARYSTIVQSGCQPNQCVGCWMNQPPLEGSGPAEDGSPRRQIIVHIHSSWGTPPLANIRAATEEAIGLWNNAQDTTCTLRYSPMSRPKISEFKVDRRQSVFSLRPIDFRWPLPTIKSVG